MRNELKQDFYDNAYLSAESYKQHYSKSPYFEVWESILKEVDNIADFACGTGQFAEMAIDLGKNYSYGVDFSQVAIDYCNRLDAKFYCDSLYNDVFNAHPYSTAVFLEVLEHVRGDREILKSLPKDKRVVISVPNWDTSSHVRYFKSAEQVKKRYKFLNISGCYTFKVGTAGKEIYVLYARTK